MVRLDFANTTLLESLVPHALLRALRQPDLPTEVIAEACAQLEAALGALIPFVPVTVADAVLANPSPRPFAGQHLVGSILFAEISGFAALSADMAARGRRGSEMISALINRIYAALLDEITPRGGGVVKFGGDTLTAFFDAARVGSRHAALASAAALAMQERLDRFEPISGSNGPFRLRLRIAVHSGRTFAAEVGDQTHSELIITGRAINQVAIAQESAAPGEVIITEETLRGLDQPRAVRRFGELFLLQGLTSEPRLLSTPPQPWQPGPPSEATLDALIRRLNALAAFVPSNLPARYLDPNTTDGEFRPVTVLFANFYPLSKLLALLEVPALVEQDAAIVWRVLDTYYRNTQMVIQRYGGTINKIDMAIYGDRLMAIWGAPIAREDDPARAVQAALTLRASHNEINAEIAGMMQAWGENYPQHRPLVKLIRVVLNQRIGLSSGTVYAGIVGTPQRRDYTVVGAPVSLAARMMSAAADGDVLLSSETYHVTRSVVKAQPLPPLSGREGERPVPVFRAIQQREVVGEFDDSPAVTPLIGRGGELEDLLATAQAALRLGPEAGGVVAISGETGVGKTRLARELAERLRATLPTTKLVWGVCQSYEQTTAHTPIVQLLRQLLRIVSGDERSTQAEVLERRVQELVPAWRRFTPLLAELLGIPMADNELVQALTPAQRRDRLHDLIIEIVLATARRQPLVLTLDDLHWADASSMAIVRRLMDELAGAPLLLVLLYRPMMSLDAEMAERPNTVALALRDLSREDSERMLAALLDGPVPEELGPLLQRGESTPFLLEETVRYLKETGALQRDPQGHWISTRPVDSNVVPAQIEQVIVGRMDRLSADSRALLQIAAVLGQQFSGELLVAISALLHVPPQRLGELMDAALVMPLEGQANLIYAFRHAVLRDVAYSTMLFARRRELHELVAGTIERMYAAELETYRVILSQHYLRADRPDRAFPHLLLAAQYAQAHYANAEALALYQQALAISPWRDQDDQPADLVTAIVLYENLGDVLALTGDYAAAREQYERLLAMLRVSNAVRRAALQRKTGATYEQQGNLEHALIWLQRAAESIRHADAGPEATVEHGRLLSDIGWVQYRRNDLEAAQANLIEGLQLVRPLETHPEEARIFNRLGGIAYGRGDPALAQEYVEQSLLASQRSGDLVGQANALNNLSILTENQGNSVKSIEYSLQALEVNNRIGNRRGAALAAINIGWAFYNLEDYKQAQQYLTYALEKTTEVRDNFHQRLALLNLGRVLLMLNDWSGAERVFNRSLFLAVQLHLPAEELDCHVGLGELALGRGDLPLATQEYEQALVLAEDKNTEEYGRLLRLEARIRLAEGEREKARELLEASEALFLKLQNVPEAQRSRALLQGIE